MSPVFGAGLPTFEQALGQITTLQQEMAVLRAQIEWFKMSLRHEELTPLREGLPRGAPF